MVKTTLIVAVAGLCGLLPGVLLIGLAFFVGPGPATGCDDTGPPTISGADCDAGASGGPVDDSNLPAAPERFTGAAGGGLPDPSGTGGWVTRAAAHLYAQARIAFPDSGWSCWDAHVWNPTSDHPQGRACDITFGNTPGVMPTSDQRDRGWRIARWLRRYADVLHVDYLIYDGRIWSTDDPAWRPYVSDIYDTSSPTGGHYDHIHVSVTM